MITSSDNLDVAFEAPERHLEQGFSKVRNMSDRIASFRIGSHYARFEVFTAVTKKPSSGI
jgi:hypothetical protein